ncbi:MAG: hypothetical protein KJZ80_19795 [Hyphomicrobiaceae bacterium]|nr:hypothetical protein [Hyphomicrobiaceae bacterium]
MSKRISDLNETIASRARRTVPSRQPDRQRPRLAERLVALAPLARAPLVPESDAAGSDAPAAGLSRLADTPRFQHRAPPRALAPARNALVPRSSSVLRPARISTPLSRVGEQSTDFAAGPVLPASYGRGTAAFLVGLSVAAAIGIALYAVLI